MSAISCVVAGETPVSFCQRACRECNSGHNAVEDIPIAPPVRMVMVWR
jgi:hypothetical protein